MLVMIHHILDANYFVQIDNIKYRLTLSYMEISLT